MGIAEIIAGIKTTYSAATTAIETRDAVKLNETKLTLSNQMLELYTAAFALLETNAEQSAKCRKLEEQIVQLEQKSNERACYELAEPYPGTVVYRLKPEYESSKPAHYICPTCMDNRSMKSIIQFNDPSRTYGKCNECKVTYQFREDEPLVQRASTQYDPYA